jgi:hypothetical protein
MDCNYSEKDRSLSFLISLFVPLSFLIILVWGLIQTSSLDFDTQLKGRGKIRGALEATSMIAMLIVIIYAVLKICSANQINFFP